MINLFTKQKCLLVFLLLILSRQSIAQPGIGLSYGFGVTPTSTNIVGPVTINMLTLHAAAQQDELDTLLAPAGMSVNFGGIVYDRVSVSTNGWLALVPSSAGLPLLNPFPPNPVNSLSTNALGYPVIAPLWDDLSTSVIQYNWTAPVLTVKWTGKWDKTNASGTNAFGVKIDGTTGLVTFFYNTVAYAPTFPSASIGIAGVCTGDFTSVNVISATTAVSDSVVEYNAIATRPNNVNYIFTPYNSYDNCASAKDLGTMNNFCTLSGNFSNVHATTSGSGMACAAGEVKDVWFKVIKPVGVLNVRVTTAPGTCQPSAGTTVEVRTSCAGASIGCSTTGSTYPTFGEVDVARPFAAETLYVRVTGDGDAIGKFKICVKDNGCIAIWTGLTDDLFSSPTNWGDCGIVPECGIDAVVNPTLNGRQPNVIGSQGVKNITINAGATLTLAAGATLTVCGNFTNYGNLVCNPGSTILFIGTTAQTISGNLTGANAFANLSVLKTVNSLTLAANIDLKENFTTLNATSVFNIGGKYMKVAGDFTNNTSPTTFTGIANSRVEFNGTGNQYLNNINGATGITMNRVIMNKTGGKLYLNSANSTLNIDSVLTLTSGNIVTRNFSNLEVFVKWASTPAVIGHSAASYIDGKLRRAVYTGTGVSLPYSLDYPVGDSTVSSVNRYELANVTFTSGTVIPDLLGYFSPWPSSPPMGPVANECNGVTYNYRQFLDHGFWTFSKTNTSPFNGIYKLTMNNTGYSNGTGTAWTIAKADKASNPSLAASWSLIGQCVASSTASIVQRVNINGVNPYSITTTLGSNIILTSNTSQLSVGAAISGVGIPIGSVITSIMNSGAFVISNVATASGTVTGNIGSTASTATSFNHLYAIAVTDGTTSLQVAATQTAPILCNGGQATIQISATGGVPPYQGTGSFNVSAGTHSFTVTDSNGSSVTTNIVVTEPTVLSAGATATAILCNGGLSSVTVSATGGTLPYTGTGTFSVLAGTYSYTVTDANGCSTSTPITITEPTPIIVISSATPILCNGGLSTVTVSATGGATPYTGTGSFSVIAGQHTFTVVAANGCSDTTQINISQPTAIVASSSSTAILCYGGSSTISITATGGITPYSGIGNFSVTAGTYVYTVTDANGCSSSTPITITQPNPFVATATLTSPILCHGGNATIAINTTGGSSNYSASFSVGAGTQNYTLIDANGCSSTASIIVTEPDSLIAIVSYLPITCYGGTANVLISATGGTAPYIGTGSYSLSAGTHSITITDANGCTLNKSITLTEPPQIFVTTSSGSINCFGGVTTVLVSATGGSSPYNGTGSFTVSAGINNFLVTDANGCTSSATINIASPSELIVSSMQTSSISCNGGSANVSISATGGMAPYTGIGTYTALAGTHTYTVIDANGCSSSSTITITQPNLFVATATLTSPILCHGGNATIAINTTGGSSNYSASFSVGAGAQNFTIIDANGCASTASIVITQPDSLKAIVSYLPISCYGGTTSLLVSAIGGTGPYTGTESFTVAAGTQAFSITDANGCTANKTVTISQPTQLIASAASGTINCFGGTTTVTIAAVGGTGSYSGVGSFTVVAGNYNYTVTDANSCSANVSVSVGQAGAPVSVLISQTTAIACFGNQATLSVSASGGDGIYTGTGTFLVAAGNHSFTVSDASGCSATNSITISEPSQIIASSSANAIMCYGGLASVNVTAVGGTGPYVGTGSYLAGVGSHSFNVSDANGCTTSTAISLSEPTKVEGVASSTSAGCSGVAGTATVVATGGVGAYTYLWSNGQTNQIATGLQAGSYTVTISDANNCTGSVSTSVVSGGIFPTTPGAITGPTSLCRNTTGVVYSISPVAGATSYSWVLPSGATGTSTSNSITISVSSIYSGGFLCVTAINGCGSSASSCMNIPVIATYPSRPTVVVGPSITCGPGTYFYSTSSTNVLSYTWSVTGTGVSIISGQGTNSIAVSVPSGFGQGSIQVYASNCYGNSTTRGMTITGMPLHSNGVSGPSYICANNTAVYSMSLVTGVSPSNYLWTVTGDATIAGTNVGASSSTATINFGPGWTSGVVTITVSNSCGSFARSFTVRSTPTQPSSITGLNTGLCEQTNVAYSIAAVATATSYTWTVPAGVTITSTSPNGQSIVVDFTPAFISNSANICVTANNSCGASVARCYTVTSRTVAPTITGPTSVCQSQINVAYTISPLAGTNTYAWSVSDNGILTPSGNTVTVNFNPVTNSSAIIRASATNPCGISPIGALSVNVNNLCRTATEPNNNNQNSILFFPNPVSEIGVISIHSSSDQDCILTLTDVLGKTISIETLNLIKGENKKEIDFSGYVSGVYYLNLITSDNFSNVVKVVVE